MLSSLAILHVTMSGTGRLLCYFLYATLLLNLISDTNGQMLDRVGLPGSPGAPGIKGEKGQKGEKGEVGPFGITGYETSEEDEGVNAEKSVPPMHGSEADPATSCQDARLDTSLTGPSVVIYPAKPFQVNCTFSDEEEEDFMTCLLKSKTNEFKGEGYKFQKNPFWLSDAGFDLLNFYDVKHISQLKYLLKISYKVSLEIIVHCMNMEISENREKFLQFHLWDGQNIGPSPDSQSPVYYEIPEELNKCKNFTGETKWETAVIKLSAPSTFIKDFYIQDIKEGKEQGIYLELKQFCLYK